MPYIVVFAKKKNNTIWSNETKNYGSWVIQRVQQIPNTGFWLMTPRSGISQSVLTGIRGRIQFKEKED